MKPLRRLALLLLLTLAPTPPAFAQSPTPAHAAPTKNAEQLYREGMDFVAKKKWSEAEARFRDAFALSPTYDTAVNLGQTQQELGKHRDAAEHLSFAIRNWPVAGKREPRELAIKTLAELRALVGTVTVEASTPGALLSVNGREIGRAPIAYELFVDPGPVTVEAQFEGYQTARQTLTAEKGKRYEVKLALEKVPAPVPKASTSVTTTVPPLPAARSALPVFVLGGLAVVGAGVGLGLNLAASSDAASVKSTADDIRTRGKSCVNGATNFDSRCGDLESQARSGQTMSGVSVGLLVGAGVLAAGTVLYWFFPGAPPVRVGASVVPERGRTAGAFVVDGRF